jgi:hypothetical protein
MHIVTHRYKLANTTFKTPSHRVSELEKEVPRSPQPRNYNFSEVELSSPYRTKHNSRHDDSNYLIRSWTVCNLSIAKHH